MRIIELSAENIKRLRAIDITPAEHVQVITGKNAAGKSSVLDAIWLALGGGTASRGTAKPIREGQEQASVRLDLGDLIVTRTWAGDKTTLKVETAEGAKYSSPQGVLDALVGRMSFDPLEFTRFAPREQLSALLDIVDLNIDLKDVAAKRTFAYDQRTEIGRHVKILEGQAASLGKPEEGVPEAEVSVSDLIVDYRRADLAHSTYAAAMRQESELTARIESLRGQVTILEGTLAKTKAIIEATGELPDLDVIQARIDTAEATNTAVRHNAERAKVKANLLHAKSQYEGATNAIEAIDKTKADALAAAKFPVDGLGFDDDGVTYQGVPFAQASASEQIRVSLAMAMALNPKLRVVRILDGSLLDADSMALIAQMAAAKDYQVWIERVDDGSGVGVLIEDGQVANA